MIEDQNSTSESQEIFGSQAFEIIDKVPRQPSHKEYLIKKQSFGNKQTKRSISAIKVDDNKMNINNGQVLKKSKDDHPLTNQEQLEFKLIQVEISDFIIIEHQQNGKEYKILDQNDWKKIIKQKSLTGYMMHDIHVSLLTQNLFFIERRDIWLLFCDIDSIKQKIQQKNSSFFQYSIQDNNFSSQIDKDIPRALMGNRFLNLQENQTSLKKILMAYANYDPELGYTQGMNIIAANLLICYDLKTNDEKFLEDVEIIDPSRDQNVFYLFIYIMVELNWRSVFIPGFPGLIKMMKVLDLKFKSELPKLYEHFQESNVDLNVCFQQQYLSLLMYGISWEISRMIFDLFLFEGEQIIHTFLIGMLKYCQDNLLKMRTFEEITKFCKNEMIRQFYELFSIKFVGNKDFSTILLNLGFIKVQGEIVPPPQPLASVKQVLKENKFEIWKGTFLKNFFQKKK
ncbi:unnamed protein product (macronuclear) [Paramecium tetraurelia]|uniref:Rab-GAP TBC domain-containing protein n=1 Tax=Paramecium tetraurelia TaxID=5888 RepID=A0DDY6_PARTE|nr:uncharacterized protein GSPATT00016095001 [Paramecium tetraurelia]CAK81253.1 unnamed protein product [Paramecium tetraurelia]|eukprot:XP_001448650.1 hypothetical protein (macronuclear) [Paramecium tetraurelia strain d4-2]